MQTALITSAVAGSLERLTIHLLQAGKTTGWQCSHSGSISASNFWRRLAITAWLSLILRASALRLACCACSRSVWSAHVFWMMRTCNAHDSVDAVDQKPPCRPQMAESQMHVHAASAGHVAALTAQSAQHQQATPGSLSNVWTHTDSPRDWHLRLQVVQLGHSNVARLLAVQELLRGCLWTGAITRSASRVTGSFPPERAFLGLLRSGSCRNAAVRLVQSACRR
jgi:hypothetical protein